MNDSFHSAVDNVQRIFTIVLALSLAESFKQFVDDKAISPEDRHIHWGRGFALVAFLMLVVPFYHGMGQWFNDVYKTNAPPKPYSAYLALDSIAFLIESILFFVMSRALPIEQWRRFYISAALILTVDIVWGLTVWICHREAIIPWVCVNGGVVLVLGLILCRIRDHGSRVGPKLCLLVLIFRSILDYWFSWDFYFPPLAGQ